MKNWNAPEVKELNIAETENGFFDSDVETLVMFNDSKKPSTPTDEEKTENQFS
ncbi:MAG: hypothetical protein PUC73_10475 [Lachnospiraceae bacterium]|nr:hypothetical protein [Lachnospiraceae bacterium]